jgi:serine/threonine protein kinase
MAVGVCGALADLSIPGCGLIAAPQLVAAVIGGSLPKKRFAFLLCFLAALIIVPAWVHWPDASVHQRTAGLLILALAAYFLRVDFFAGSRPIHGISGGSLSPSALGSLSAFIGAGNRIDQPLDVTRDLRDDHSRLVDYFESTGQFEPDQLHLIESQLSKLKEDESGFVENRASLMPGDHIGRYEVESQLGRGGAGYIFRGRDRLCGDPVAIKILHNAEMTDRFRHEMRIVQELAHPNIVTAYEVADFRGLPYIAMEVLRGPDLSELVRKEGPICWRESARYILQMARALAHAHRRDLIHRDIKPGNIMLNGDGSVKLVDLGLAVTAIPAPMKTVESPRETKGVKLAGTLPYMAPEQARSLRSANNRSDIYGLGATWFFLLTGKPRLPGKTFSQQFGNLLSERKFRALPEKCLPDAFYKIYQRMVVYDPNDRYASCDELVGDLEHALSTAGEPVAPNDIHVLVVEDSRADMLRTISVLGKTNQSLAIHQATSLAEGLDKYKCIGADMVLLDLTLPDSSGTQTVEAFRSAAPEVPIVVLTGYSDDEISAACIGAGATGFLSKDDLSAHTMERTIFVTLSRHALATERSSSGNA